MSGLSPKAGAWTRGGGEKRSDQEEGRDRGRALEQPQKRLHKTLTTLKYGTPPGAKRDAGDVTPDGWVARRLTRTNASGAPKLRGPHPHTTGTVNNTEIRGAVRRAWSLRDGSSIRAKNQIRLVESRTPDLINRSRAANNAECEWRPWIGARPGRLS